MISPSDSWKKNQALTNQDDEHKSLKMVQGLESRAVRCRWNIPPKAMQEIMEHQVAIATSDDFSPGAKTKAANTCIKMVAQDREEEVIRAQTINIGGSMVIGADAISAAISSRMAIEAAEGSTSEGPGGSS